MIRNETEGSDEARAEALARLNQKLQAGLDSLKRGKGVPGEEVFDELDRQIEALRDVPELLGS